MNVQVINFTAKNKGMAQIQWDVAKTLLEGNMKSCLENHSCSLCVFLGSHGAQTAPWGCKLGPQPNLASVGNAETWGRQNQTGFHFGECQNRIGFPLGDRG